jgi:hypothetical protein
MKVRAKLERFTKMARCVENIDEPTDERIEETIDGMDHDWSTTIELTCGKNTMLISASNGRYAVMVNMSDSTDFFDLVGKPHDAGNIAFVHGGQPAEHPARHVVPREEAAEAAKAFVRDCGASLPRDFPWEKQSV